MDPLKLSASKGGIGVIFGAGHLKHSILAGKKTAEVFVPPFSIGSKRIIA
jgi:hypothetical protein